MDAQKSDKFDQWCVLDLFGHQRTAGHVTEASIGGCSFIRIDVPQSDGTDRTEFYGNGAIYSMRPVSEEVARAVATEATAPVQRWDLERLGLVAATDAAAETDDDIPW